jgi:hypothetical protein
MPKQIEFDKEHGVQKWLERFKRMKAETIYKLSDPVKDAYLDAVENTIKNTPATSGETRAGWAKPLEAEGRSLVSVISPEANILSKKDVDPTQNALDKGMKYSIYRKETDKESIHLETINGAPGAVYTEYGDSKTPPTAAVRQAAMTLVEDLKEVVGTTLKEVSK